MEIDELLEKNGYEVDSLKVFIKQAKNIDANKLINDLNEYRSKMTDMGDYIAFAKGMSQGLKEFKDILVSDESFAYSRDTSDVTNRLNSLMSKFEVIENFQSVKANYEEQLDFFRDLQKRIDEAENDKNLVGEARNKKAKELLNLSKSLEGTRTKALFEYKKAQKMMASSLGDLQKGNFANDLIQEVNALEDATKNVALTNESRESIKRVQRQLTTYIGNYAAQAVTNANKLQSLLDRYSLINKGEPKKTMGFNELNELDEPIKGTEGPENGPDAPTKGPDVPKEVEPVLDETLAVGLFSQIEKLNPDSKLTLIYSVGSKAIESDVPVEDLNLPDGYMYDAEKGVITNKEKPIDGKYVEIKAYQKEEKKSKNFISSLSESAKKLYKNIKDKNAGDKLKVTSIKGARIAPFIKQALVLGAICGVAALAPGIALVATTPIVLQAGLMGALGGVDLGLGVQALYDLAVKYKYSGKYEALENTKYSEDPYSAPGLIALYHKFAKSFIKNVKRGKARPEPVQEPEELLDEVKENPKVVPVPVSPTPEVSTERLNVEDILKPNPLVENVDTLEGVVEPRNIAAEVSAGLEEIDNDRGGRR